MGLYDTMQQGKPNQVLSAVGNGGSFAQKQPMNQNAWQANRMQKPTTGLANPMANVARQMPGTMGSRTQIQAKQQAQAVGAGLGPVQQLQQTLAKQKGLMTPYDAQIQAQNQAQAPNPMQAAAEQMRGYEGPDLGSQDPRELARMGQVSQPQLSGTTSELPMSPVPQLPEGNYGRPDVMPRDGIGPSAQLFGGQSMNPARPRISVNGFRGRSGAY